MFTYHFKLITFYFEKENEQNSVFGRYPHCILSDIFKKLHIAPYCNQQPKPIKITSFAMNSRFTSVQNTPIKKLDKPKDY